MSQEVEQLVSSWKYLFHFLITNFGTSSLMKPIPYLRINKAGRNEWKIRKFPNLLLLLVQFKFNFLFVSILPIFIFRIVNFEILSIFSFVYSPVSYFVLTKFKFSEFVVRPFRNIFDSCFCL